MLYARLGGISSGLVPRVPVFNRLVTPAGSRYEAFLVEDGHAPAAVTNEPALLQAARGLRNAGSPYAQHACKEFMRNLELVGVDAVAQGRSVGEARNQNTGERAEPDVHHIVNRTASAERPAGVVAAQGSKAVLAGEWSWRGEEIHPRQVGDEDAEQIIARRGLIQVKAAAVLGVDQPKVSAIVRGRLEKFSIERLCEFLTRLGCDVNIQVRESNKSVRGRMRIKIAS